MGDASSSAELRILTRLGLVRLAIVDQLVLVLKRFRSAQLRDLEDALNALPETVRSHIEAHFDRKLDVKDELERYVQDLLKATHLMRHLGIEGDLQRDVVVLFGALGDGRDRWYLIKILQTLGVKLTRVLCEVCQHLSHITLQQDFYRVFSASDSGLMDLKVWMQWLESLHTTPSFDTALQFLTKCAMERCLAVWLKLLGPVVSTTRVLLIERLVALNDGSLLKQIARFHDVTGLPVTELLELCPNFQALLSMLLTEFPMATTLTLFAKFNDDRLIASVDKALTLLGKGDVVRLVDTLATQESSRTIQAFFIPLVEYERRGAIVSLFLTLTKPSQVRLLDILVRADDTTEDSDFTHSATVFTFLLDGGLHSIDDVLHKLWSMSNSSSAGVVNAMKHYTSEELVLLTEGIEVLSHPSCLHAFFRLFEALQPKQRTVLVDWVLDVPGEDSLRLYEVLFALYGSSQATKAASVLQVAASLKKSHKNVLCSELLRTVSAADSKKAAIEDMNLRIVFFLCDVDPTRRHEAVRLLAAIDADAYDTLLYLLQTQRVSEQVALTKLMLSLSSSANGRLLAKIRALSGETLDEFFQLLLLIPKVEYKMLSRLLVSREVSIAQFQDFVHIAANMMNQAASREMVTFAAELPVHYRNVFFAIMAQCGTSERGVLMRIVACSTRLAPDILHLFVELLIRIPWETRSALVEQLRALEEAPHIQTYVLVLREFQDDACLPRLIHLLNLLPLAVRIALVPLFGQIQSVPERVQTLDKLNAMPKDRMPDYCCTLCDAACLPFISGAFLRVFGFLNPEFQTGMLHLLTWRTCWVFIEVLSDAISSRDPSIPDEVAGPSGNSALVNGLAASLTLLKREDDCILLGDVMEEAMGNAIRLEELIVVFAHFRDHDRLLVFLKYVAHLTTCARSTLFFRVLSRFQATSFLFDMCHVLDLDDALFALKRLDRMWQRNAESVDGLLTTMAQTSDAIDARDEFCHLVLGYRERAPMNAPDPHRGDRSVAPRANDSPDSTTHKLDGVEDRSWKWDEVENVIDPDRLSAVSVRPLPLDKQLQRVHDKREDARRRRRRRNWREWNNADWEDALVLPTDLIATKAHGSEVVFQSSENPNEPTSEPLAIVASPEMLPEDLDGAETPSVLESHPPASGAEDSHPRLENLPSSEASATGVVLPPIRLTPQTVDRPHSGDRHLSVQSSLSSRVLNRSESAPTTLHGPMLSRSKVYRGLHAALDLESSDEHHVARDRGLSIFHKQCEYVNEHGPSRIRFSKSEKGRAKVNAARIQHSIGRRDCNDRTPSKSSLLRNERRTIELATTALANGEHTRSQSHDVGWIRKSTFNKGSA